MKNMAQGLGLNQRLSFRLITDMLLIIRLLRRNEGIKSLLIIMLDIHHTPTVISFI